MYRDGLTLFAILAMVVLWVTALAGWVNHIIICIKASSWILLAFGVIVPPIGVIHGVGSWFGAF
jgi:hypothetical protein